MTCRHLPEWLRLGARPDDPTDAIAALDAARERQTEVDQLVTDAKWHRDRDHFADRLRAVFDEDDVRPQRSRRGPAAWKHRGKRPRTR